MYVRMTLDYKERKINMRIRNKFSVISNPKSSEHRPDLVKRSSLFYAQVWANEERV